MKRALTLLCLFLTVTLAGACRSSKRATPEATQENFGVNMARMNLWREALFRFKRAVQLNPGDAMAHNNLAVAYEANGDFENAAKEYREAMRLDKTNQYIQKNYSRYVEFTSRNKKRQKTANAPKTASASTTTTPVPPAVTSTEPPANTSSAPPSPTPPPAVTPATVPPTPTAPNPQPAPPPKPPGDFR